MKRLASTALVTIAAGLAGASPAGAASYSNATAIRPADGGQLASAISVTGEGGSVANVRVSLIDLGTDSAEDVDVLLVSPAGQRALVVSDACAAGSFINASLAFDDAAPFQIPDACGTANGGGTFPPTDRPPADSFAAPAPAPPYPASLGGFAGAAPNGTWTLYVVDDGIQGDRLFLDGGWRLDVSTSPPKKCKKGQKLKKGKCAKKKKKKRK
jgi:hypothetical protein